MQPLFHTCYSIVGTFVLSGLISSRREALPSWIGCIICLYLLIYQLNISMLQPSRIAFHLRPLTSWQIHSIQYLKLSSALNLV